MMINKRVDNDLGVEFLGETNSLITYTNLSTHFNVTEGNLNATNQTNRWLHFRLDDKEIYVSKVAIRNWISWDHLYSKGLVYGTNNNGVRPTGTPTNQYRTITLNGKLYKARLLKGCNEGQDPYTHIPGVEHTYYDPPNSYQSEWSRLFYPIITDDTYAKSYTGPMLASYTETDLQMRWVNEVTTPGSYAWCQETHSTFTASRVIRGYLGPSYLRWNTSSIVDASLGWRCCLEEV